MGDKGMSSSEDGSDDSGSESDNEESDASSANDAQNMATGLDEEEIAVPEEPVPVGKSSATQEDSEVLREWRELVMSNGIEKKTIVQLTAFLESEGVEIPKRAKKNMLLDLVRKRIADSY